ncbi:hypothetical protein F5B21DRAFT_520250 [Xylaria acuta]|nr:hypothetical protein F5B21DRAFT_520250 [Xylaria acuta]
MDSQLVQAQWSLNKTLDSVYGIARGPLAIMACERFGNTLTISRDTRLKIERTVLPTPEPVSIRFLKAKVGFMKHDCAVQLGILISSVPAIHCAEALIRLLPTARHLRDLMFSLEGRCRLLGFANVVFGYNSIIIGASRAKGYQGCRRGDAIPNSQGLAAFVDACRHLQRVGDHEISSITVEVRKCAAWVAAFSKWSLELPPSIYFVDGTPIVSQPGPQNEMKITKRYKLDSIQDLVVQCSSRILDSYHFQVKTYCDMLSSHCESDGHSVPFLEKGPGSAQNFTLKLPDYLPSKKVLYGTMRLVFGLDLDFPFDSLVSEKCYGDLPEVEHYFHMTKVCSGVEDAPFDWYYDLPYEIKLGEDGPPSQYAFVKKLGIICSSLFSLSLFDNIEDLYFIIPSFDCQKEDKLNDRIERLLISGTDSTPFNPGNTLTESLGLLTARPFAINYDSMLVLSTRTHLFWCSILDGFAAKSTGVLCMTSCRERDTYHCITTDMRIHKRPNVTALEIGFPYPKLRWELGVFLGSLHACLGGPRQSLPCDNANLALINHRELETVYGYIQPTAAIAMLKSSILVNCKHRVKMQGEVMGLLSKGYRAELQIFPIGRVAEGNGRDVSKASPTVVIQQGACFACCIEACEMYRTLVIPWMC